MSLFGAIFGMQAKRLPARPGPGAARAPEDLWSKASRSEEIRRAVELLPDLSPELAKELVWDVARGYFAHVADLPAAEKYHHAGPFGLYEHSLEVAERALRLALSEHFAENTRAYPEEQEYRVPRLRYAAWLLGLLHDSGKVAHVEIRAGHETWNPYDETLEAFYVKNGRDRSKLTWKVGRGLDIHTWHNAYLIGRFLSGPVARYLGPRLTGQLIEQETPASREVLRLVSEADHRSTRDSVRNPGRTAEPAESVAAGQEPLLVGGGEFVDRIPELFRRAIAEGVLRATPAPGEVLSGDRWVLIRYPAALQKFAFVLREHLGSTYARARALTATETGARELARVLHEHRKLFADPQSDAWKVKAKLSGAAGFDVTDAVLVDRTWLAPARDTLPEWEGDISFVRAEDERPLRVDGWPERRPKVTGPAAPPPRPPPEESLAPVTVTPAIPSRPANPAPTIVGARKFISGEQLLGDIRQAILDGTIPSNAWNAPCYVLEATTYLASPIGFQCLVEKGLYTRDPRKEVNVYLDALVKCPAVRKKAGGRVLGQVSIRPGARPLWVVAFETKGFFTDPAELARVGYWTQSPITELSEEEARAMKAALKSGGTLPAPEASHA
jgi:hypothetical protein